MRAVFADTVFWVAIFRHNDPWKLAARHAKKALGRARLVTTDEVLTEFLTALSAAGPLARTQAAQFVRTVLSHPEIEVRPQSRQSFLRGLELYETRLDKNYSLTDCISMNVMRAASIDEALTNDRHFSQEGFTVLMTQKE